MMSVKAIDIEACLALQLRRRRQVYTVGHKYYKTVHRGITINGTGKELYFAVGSDGNVQECVFDYWHEEASQGDPHCTTFQ